MIPTSNGWYLKAVQLGLLSAYKSTFACTGWPHSSLPHMSKEGYRHCRSGVHMPACLHILHHPTYAPLAEVSRGLWQVSTKRWKRLELRWQNYQRKCVTPCWNICESRWFRIWRAFHVPSYCLARQLPSDSLTRRRSLPSGPSTMESLGRASAPRSRPILTWCGAGVGSGTTATAATWTSATSCATPRQSWGRSLDLRTVRMLQAFVW